MDCKWRKLKAIPRCLKRDKPRFLFVELPFSCFMCHPQFPKIFFTGSQFFIMFSQHIFHCHLGLSVSAFQAPETVEDPKNQTVVAGFNVTLNCTAEGSPMPSITWIKNNDLLAIQSNPRIKDIQTVLDYKQIHSQLVIEDAKKKDEGKYHCVANNTVGEKASNPAFLFVKDLGETYAVYFFLTWHQVL